MYPCIQKITHFSSSTWAIKGPSAILNLSCRKKETWLHPTVLYLLSYIPLFFPSSWHFVLMVRGKHVFLKDHHSLSLFYYPTHLWQWSISSYQPTPHSSSFQKIAGLIALVLFQVCLFISVCLTAYAVNFKLVVWKPNDCNPVSLTKATFCLHY